MAVTIGDQAPAFTAANSSDGQEVSLADFRGKQNVFLVFYPQAFSPVCSVQLPRYNSHLDGFHSRDTAVVAVSGDNSFSQQAFCASLGGIEFPVLSDLTLDIARKYGVDLPGGYSNRAEFLIDKAGVVRWANVEKSAGDDTPTMDDIFSAIDSL